MSYHLYQTEGFVLSGRSQGESNRYLCLFTKELGLVKALVQGARKLESKLRFHLENYTYGHFTLVRGREIWRLTGAEKISRFKDPLIARIALLLGRLVTGEEKDQDLFEDLKRAFLYLENSHLSGGERTDLETILVLRIMDRLGYLKKEPETTPFVSFENWESVNLVISPVTRDGLSRRINQALRETQL